MYMFNFSVVTRNSVEGLFALYVLTHTLALIKNMYFSV